MHLPYVPALQTRKEMCSSPTEVEIMYHLCPQFPHQPAITFKLTCSNYLSSAECSVEMLQKLKTDLVFTSPPARSIDLR